MSKVRLVIEIDERILEHIEAKELPLFMVDDICRAVENGTPITEGDLISRQELLDNIQKVIEDNATDEGHEDWDKGYNCGLQKACELIETALSIGENQNEQI